MIGVARAQTHARAVIKPETAPFGLSAWNFQPLSPPDALHPLGVDDPCDRKSPGKENGNLT